MMHLVHDTTTLFSLPDAQRDISAQEGPLPFYRVCSLLKCPVIGVCLSLAEQRKIVRRAGALAGEVLPFDVHEALVSLTDEDNTLARRVDALLRKKYESAAAPLRQLNLLAFMKHWDAAFTGGNFAAELWAAASRPDMPLHFHRHIFGCVHMAMHEAFEKMYKTEEDLRQFRQERHRAEEKFRAVKLSLATAHKEQRALKVERDALQRQNAQLTAENRLLRDRASLASADGMLSHGSTEAALRARLDETIRHLESVTHQLHEEEKRHAASVEEMEVQRGLAVQLQKEIGLLLKSSGMCAQCEEECGACRGCPRRVLLVGGMERMESLYRQLVEARGDEFEYHDGHPRGIGTLKNCLQRADVVLCPVNCNSHGACLMVKELCKKYNKTLHMMPNFSLSAVSRVIESQGDTLN